MTIKATLLASVCMLGFVAGCSPSPSGPPKYRVSGNVTLDGKPLPQGVITVFSKDGQVRGAGGKIVEGVYSFDSFAGPKTVSIVSIRIVPGVTTNAFNPGFNEPVSEQILPQRYNTASKLEMEVVPDGPNKFDFQLTSGPPKPKRGG